MSNEDRRREIAYHDLERAEDEQALHQRPAESGGQRDGRAVSRNGTAVRESRDEWSGQLTEREHRERWPIG